MAEELNVIHEEFFSIRHLLNTLETRPQNEIMRGEHGSDESDYEFTLTHNYLEAVHLLENGDPSHIAEIKKLVAENYNKVRASFQNQRKIENMPVGFIPNVPNALQNKPDSMINIISPPQKRKTLNVIYSPCDNCRRDAEDWIAAGAAIVAALNLIELYGVQTRLYTAFMTATASDSDTVEIITPVLRIKNFGERFNLQKICFPLIHPSMFRRIGFKYLETCPFITVDYFSAGYGHHPDRELFRKAYGTIPNTYIIEINHLVDDLDCDVLELLKEMGFDNGITL